MSSSTFPYEGPRESAKKEEKEAGWQRKEDNHENKLGHSQGGRGNLQMFLNVLIGRFVCKTAQGPALRTRKKWYCHWDPAQVVSGL